MRAVLLIDDNDTQLNARCAVLRDAGFSVLTAGTAEQASMLLQLPTADVGVIVTDHLMPTGSGAVFVRRLREGGSQLPVIVVSGLAEAEADYAGLQVAFLSKPCAPQDLIRCVRAALDTVPHGTSGPSHSPSA
jgi:DNA-binding response OmpR family regulator